jgi:6-phosphogluconolactonase
MTKIFSTNKRKKLAISSAIVSFLALAAIVGIAASISASSGASNAQPLGVGSGAVYIIDNKASGNNVWAYARSSNGQLGSAEGPYSTGGLGTGSGLASQGAVVLTQGSHWLLVVDAGSNQITVFKVQGATLERTSITGSQGPDPISLTVSGNWVYVLDSGNAAHAPNIAGFTLSSDGKLTAIPGSVRALSGQSDPSPEQIGFNPQGNVLVVTEKGTNIIDTYTVNSDGVESGADSQTSAGAGPYGFAFTSQGQLIVSEAASNSVSSYSLSKTGELTIISGALPTFGNAPCWLEIDGSNHFAYTANAHGGTISSFAISTTGGLSLFSSVAAHTAIPALDMAFSQNSQFLYVRNGAVITGFQVFSDGSISSITSVSGLASSASGLAAY